MEAAGARPASPRRHSCGATGRSAKQPGYDAASGVLYKPDGENFPPVPQQPSRADALEALALLDDLIADFRSSRRADRAVALSAILTMLDRRAMTTAPLHAFTSPAPGTGKIPAGRHRGDARDWPAGAGDRQGRSEEELEKRLGAALLAGDAAISIDNCEYPLSGSLLCQALTQQRLNIRLLGQSRHVEVPVNAAIFATGNNLAIVGDLTRRVLLCGIDPRCERPELRQFDTDVIKAIQANRGILVAAALTVLRAWHVAGDRVEVSPFGSFNDWSHRIRGPISWLGRADPCDTASKVRDRIPNVPRSTLCLCSGGSTSGLADPTQCSR